MLNISSEGFVKQDGSLARCVELTSSEVNEDWVNRQNASIDEYLEHEAVVPVDIQTMYRLFDGFIASKLAGLHQLHVIDVGCGIGCAYPPYVTSLSRGREVTGNIYVGLDPLRFNLDAREYPFICGRLEDLEGKIGTGFDVFLFSTSLDHFEDLKQVTESISLLANKEAIAIFWIGLHDPVLVAEHIGCNLLRNIFTSLSPIKFIIQYLKALVKLPLHYFRLLNRQSRLNAGQPLDDLHFHYFTEANIQDTLGLFGIVDEYLRIPGTNSIFVSVRLKGR